MAYTIDPDRLDQINGKTLGKGHHGSLEQGVCVMEAVAYISGGFWTDSPYCACPVLGAFLRSWNDTLPDDKRQEFLKPLIPRLVGTKSTPTVEQRRAIMAADWMIRVHTPTWLRLAGLIDQANVLEAMPEITDFAACPSLLPTLQAVRRDASAAEAAAWAAARDAAWAAARDAAWAAAWAAARDAAGAAAEAALAPTVAALQLSALDLVNRMIDAE